MDFLDFIAAGDLPSALRHVKEAVRAAPADTALRQHLVRLYALEGNWEGAVGQLKTIGGLDAGTEMFVQVYSRVLRGEVTRREVHQGKRAAVIFGEPEEWVSLLLSGLQLWKQGHTSRGLELQEQARKIWPELPGSLNGEPFAAVLDGDSFLGPVIEAFVEGNYWWVPLSRIKSLTSAGPKRPLDLLWLPVQFCWSNGGIASGFIPARYFGSESAVDPDFKLSRKTAWHEIAPEVYQGQGQRMWLTDRSEMPVLEFRNLEF